MIEINQLRLGHALRLPLNLIVMRALNVLAFGSAGNPVTVVLNLGNQAVPNREIRRSTISWLRLPTSSTNAECICD